MLKFAPAECLWSTRYVSQAGVRYSISRWCRVGSGQWYEVYRTDSDGFAHLVGKFPRKHMARAAMNADIRAAITDPKKI